MLNTPDFIEKNISIILQGSVNKNNIHDIANHCAHWKDILPHCEIILSISSTDMLLGKAGYFSRNRKLLKKILIREEDYLFRGSINAINKYCDFIVYDENSLAVPLPPIKDDAPGTNNINFLIESSRNGLKFAHKPYSLRIRNDAVFLNTNFIKYYCKNSFLPRQKKTSSFKQRVMVSWIYTLNPFSEERLPLHISDWLHFGLTEDIKKIWEIPFLSFKDSVFFENRSHETSNIFERRFNLRLAVEQYISFAFFKKIFPHIKLDYLNDLTHLNNLMDITMDNFYIFSNPSFSLRINKHYQKELENHHKRSICITEDAWRFMVLNRQIKYSSILKGNVDNNIINLSKKTFVVKSFPKRYSSIHSRKGLYRLLIFYIFTTILSEKMKSKFLLSPEQFFCDSRFRITRTLGKIYLR